MKSGRKKILFVTGAVAPLHSTNASLMLRLLERLNYDADCQLLSVGPYSSAVPTDLVSGAECVSFSTLTQTTVSCFSAGTADDVNVGGLLKLRAKLAGRLLDRGGYGDLRSALPVQHLIERLWRHFRYDVVFASNEPYAAAYALSKSGIDAKKALYLIDPFAEMVPILQDDHIPPFRHRTHESILSAVDQIITTPRIANAMENSCYASYVKKTIRNEFPLFSELRRTESQDGIRFSSEKINLLYCGWLRSEQQLCRIIERLDNRFCVTFLGNDSARMRELSTDAEIRTFAAMPRALAVNAILDADILLSTGNPYPVHLPSKTFDYLSSGKPVIHFYSISDCPAQEFYNRYPLALCLPNDGDPEEQTGRFRRFCLEKQGERLSWNEVCRIYPELRADSIMERITQAILRERV